MSKLWREESHLQLTQEQLLDKILRLRKSQLPTTTAELLMLTWEIEKIPRLSFLYSETTNISLKKKFRNGIDLIFIACENNLAKKVENFENWKKRILGGTKGQ